MLDVINMSSLTIIFDETWTREMAMAESCGVQWYTWHFSIVTGAIVYYRIRWSMVLCACNPFIHDDVIKQPYLLVLCNKQLRQFIRMLLFIAPCYN